jgi:hypothetical protein
MPGQGILAASEWVGTRRGTAKSATVKRDLGVLLSPCNSISCSTRVANIFRTDHERLHPLARRARQGWPRFARYPSWLGLAWPSHSGRIGWSGRTRAGSFNFKPRFSPIFLPLPTLRRKANTAKQGALAARSSAMRLWRIQRQGRRKNMRGVVIRGRASLAATSVASVASRSVASDTRCCWSRSR